jgi:hypothetical protein
VSPCLVLITAFASNITENFTMYPDREICCIYCHHSFYPGNNALNNTHKTDTTGQTQPDDDTRLQFRKLNLHGGAVQTKAGRIPTVLRPTTWCSPTQWLLYLLTTAFVLTSHFFLQCSCPEQLILLASQQKNGVKTAAHEAQHTYFAQYPFTSSLEPQVLSSAPSMLNTVQTFILITSRKQRL